jgi:FixJ family two-component response regulator
MLEDAIVHVVDDDELMRNSLEDLLRSVGYQVRLYGRADDFLSPTSRTPRAASSSTSACPGQAVSSFRRC